MSLADYFLPARIALPEVGLRLFTEATHEEALGQFNLRAAGDTAGIRSEGRREGGGAKAIFVVRSYSVVEVLLGITSNGA